MKSPKPSFSFIFDGLAWIEKNFGVNKKGIRMCCAFSILVPFLWSGCGQDSSSSSASPSQQAIPNKPQSQSLFTRLDPASSGVQFQNTLEETAVVNTFVYFHAYCGGGVSVGDINNDGLPDLYFTGNTVDNKLYLNKGDLKFEDITESAGVVFEGDDWTMGTTMVDINADGYLDIYVSRAFHTESEFSRNLLYINNGDLTFTERGKEYGVADDSWTTQATFLDYDMDGDLDLFVANHLKFHSMDHSISLQNMQNPPYDMSNHLYRNNGDETFTDVTREAGVVDYGATLGIVASDLNEDGWPDIYVANDKEEPDVLYLNQKDGTFKDGIYDAFGHTCMFSMGIDIADMNNDGHQDIFVADMLAEDNFREKTSMASMNPDAFWERVNDGYHYQVMRNVLQLNNGNHTFSEIGYLSGVEATDWSWAAFFADVDNDGLKDLFVANGHKRDVLDKDFIKELDKKLVGGVYEGDITDLMEMIPSKLLPNKLFRNEGDLTFSDQSEAFGLGEGTQSNGATYTDLDGDGDLEIIINNVSSPAFIYENHAFDQGKGNYLQVKLVGEGYNPNALGAKVTVKSDELIQFQEVTMTRGFKSSMEPMLHFGMADKKQVDLVQVVWPDGTQTEVQDLTVNQLVTLKKSEMKNSMEQPWFKTVPQLFTDVTSSSGVDFKHEENDYDDYQLEVLLPHKTSQYGSKIAVGDIDTDGLDDFFIGGAHGQSGCLYRQNSAGSFEVLSGPWEADAECEDIDATFFDANGDGVLDLFVVSGGNEFPADDARLQDRLYIGLADGGFVSKPEALPKMITSGGCVSVADYDGDGDLDLFVGGRLIPGKYPYPPRSYLLRNNGGKFFDVTHERAKPLVKPGLVSSALWSDFDGDADLDLVMVGEWMPIRFVENKDGVFVDHASSETLNQTTVGWWNKIVETDLDEDGDPDYVAGNLGLNYKYKASKEEPFQVYGKDFDRSGTHDIVLGYFENGVCFPVRGLQCSSQQIPQIYEKFSTYKEFGAASLLDIYGSFAIQNALHYQAQHFASSIIMNDGEGSFEVKSLPIEAQIAPIQGIVVRDLDADGRQDLVLAGNWYPAEVETGRADAGVGVVLKGDGEGGFSKVHSVKQGLYVPGDVRDLAWLTGGGLSHLVVAKNDDEIQVIRYKKE